MSENNNAARIYAGEVFLQLMESERFKTFVAANFDIHNIVDDEKQVVHTRVIEKPPEKVMEDLMQSTPELLKAMHESETVEPDPAQTGKTRQQKAVEASADKLVLPPATLIKLHHLLSKAGCKKPSATVQNVLKLLGKPEQSLILPPAVGEGA